MKQQPTETVVNELLSFNISAYGDNDWQWQFYDLPAELNAGKTAVLNVSDTWRQSLSRPITELMQGSSTFNTTGPGDYGMSYPDPMGAARLRHKRVAARLQRADTGPGRLAHDLQRQHRAGRALLADRLGAGDRGACALVLARVPAGSACRRLGLSGADGAGHTPPSRAPLEGPPDRKSVV